jgi:hypothetical protein
MLALTTYSYQYQTRREMRDGMTSLIDCSTAKKQKNDLFYDIKWCS